MLMMSDIELSSDSEVEEEEDDEVSLIVMKRPAKIERTVKDIEVGIKVMQHYVLHLKCRLWILLKGLETQPPSQPKREPARSRSTLRPRGWE